MRSTNKRLRKITKILMVAFLISIFALSIVSCKLIRAFADKEVLQGSGNIISEDRDVAGFSKISITSRNGTLFIEQGEEESLTIEAEDNIIPLIITEVSGNTLNIRFKLGVNQTDIKEVNYYLKLKDLNLIKKSGSVHISCLSLDADSLTIEKSGSGDIEMSNLTAINLEVSTSGSGSITLAGSVDNHEIEINGSGEYNAGDLVSVNCVVDSTGSTDVTVNVTDSLDIKTSGSGDVKYIGLPTINADVSGSGEVIYIEK